MKAKKVAAGIVVLVLVIVSVLYGVVEYNYTDIYLSGAFQQ